MAIRIVETRCAKSTSEKCYGGIDVAVRLVQNER
jgi:hypothetical protein